MQDLLRLLRGGQVGYAGPNTAREDFQRFLHGETPRGGLYSPEQQNYTPDMPWDNSDEDGSEAPPTMLDADEAETPAQPQESTGPMDARAESPMRAERMDEATGQPEYESLLHRYLGDLQKPSDMPRRKPMSGYQAMALVLASPDRRREMMEFFDRPYQDELARWQHGEGRRGQAVQMAMGLENLAYQRRREEADKAWDADLVNANQGNLNWNYRNPQLKSLADTVHKYRYRDTRGPGDVPGNREQYISRLQDDLAQVHRMAADWTAADTAMAQLKDPRWAEMRAKGENQKYILDRLKQLQRELDVVSRMSEEEYQRYISMSGRARQMFLEGGDDPFATPVGAENSP